MSELPIKESCSNGKNLENEMDEDLSSLLDDALQDFETMPAFSVKPNKNMGKGAKNSSRKGEVNANRNTSSTERNKQGHGKGSRTNNGNSNFSLKDDKSNLTTQNKQPNDAPNAFPSEKELEEMFNDLMKSASLENLPKDDTNNPNLDNVLPMMENMMQSLLSSDVLYPPLKELCNKYPEWLAENRQSLKSKEYDDYNKQYHVARELCHEFERHKSLNDSNTKITEDAQNTHFEKVFELMQKMQSFGNPPADIVGEFGTIPNCNATGNVQQEEGLFQAFLAQTGIDADRGLQFDPNGRPIIPEGFSENGDKCIVS